MTEKTEALRLASILDTCNWLTAPTDEEIAAELRRLHAENERLHQINQSHEMKLSVRGYEIQIADLEAQRDALLEALKAGPGIEHTLPTGPCACSQCQFVRMRSAAIKAVEGESHAKNL